MSIIIYNSFFFMCNNERGIITSVLQKRKLRLRKMDSLCQCHMAGEYGAEFGALSGSKTFVVLGVLH